MPPIAGFDRPGTSVLRSAADAMELRAFAQHRGSRNAVVAGGGRLGLWATAAAQAEVAVENIAGRDRSYAAVVPATALKVAGIDMTSIGQFEAAASDQEAIVLEDPAAARYRKLVIAEGRTVRAILLGAGNSITAMVRAAIAGRQDITGHLPELRAGWWDVLA